MVGKAPKDVISIAWNEESGNYAVSGLIPPTGATQLILKTRFDGKVKHTTAVPLSSATAVPSPDTAFANAAVVSAYWSQKKDAALGPQAVDQAFTRYA